MNATESPRSPLDTARGSVAERACPVCGASGGAPAGTRDDGGQWRACGDCEAVYLSPAPDDAALASFYSTYYTDYRTLNLPPLAALESIAMARRLDPLTDFALQTIGRTPQSAADVGCGQGARLAVLRALGAAHVAGSEMDEGAAKWAREHYRVDVHAGSASAIPLPSGGFEVVFLSEVIEHVLDPVALLRECARLLAPGGLLALSTPNGSTRHRAGRAWTQLHIDLDHVTIYNDVSIRRALRAAGLDPLEVLTHGRPSISAERWRQGSFEDHLPRWAKRANNVARRLLAGVRTPHVPLDPHDGYTLLVSARRPA